MLAEFRTKSTKSQEDPAGEIRRSPYATADKALSGSELNTVLCAREECINMNVIRNGIVDIRDGIVNFFKKREV